MSGFPFSEVYVGLVMVVIGFMYALSVQEIGKLKKTIADLKCELEEMKGKQ